MNADTGRKPTGEHYRANGQDFALRIYNYNGEEYVIETCALTDIREPDGFWSELGGTVGLPTARFKRYERAKAFVDLACALKDDDDAAFEAAFWPLLEASLLLDRRDAKERGE